MTSRDRHIATYLYPGVFFPEETTRELSKPTFEQALAAAPDSEEGFFCKDGWYAVRITTIHEKKFVANDGEETWVKNPSLKEITWSWIIGEKIRRDDERLSDPKFNSMKIGDEEYFVLARCGNWQPANYYNYIVSEDEIKSSYQVSV